MKQIIILTASFIFFVPTLQAQTRSSTTSAHDNINHEYRTEQQLSPQHLSKYALIQKDGQSTNAGGNPDKINLNNHTVTPYPKQDSLKIVHPKKIYKK